MAHVSILGGGTAVWSTPIQCEPDRYRANFEAHLVFRYTFENGRQLHFKTHYSGIDDINGRGEAYAGTAYHKSVDEDGDELWGDCIWNEEDPFHDRFTYHGGTGKWEGASGRSRIHAWTQATDKDQKLPADRPIRYWGFLDGEGDLEHPNFQP
jgi:hypothetical protein